MPRPRHPKPDANQAQVIRDLRACGFVVWDLSSLGGEVLDLLVGGWNAGTERWEWWPVEIKVPEGRLTEAQKHFLEAHPDVAIVARCAEDVLRAFGQLE